MKRLVILISGRGSNMAAILEAERAGAIDGRVVGVISNRPDAGGLAIAARHGVATMVIDHRAAGDRQAFGNALASAIYALSSDLIVLAGFMRILDAAFVGRYEGRLLNIHPSLFPLYPGLNTHQRALADGVKIHGCTVHFVTSQVDHGPIVAQGAVPVLEDDNEATLAARVLEAEHRILVASILWFCEDRLVIDGKRVRVKEESAGTRGEDAAGGTLIVPAMRLS